MLGPGLAGLAAFCLVVSALCFTLKGQLLKPNRILDSAEDSGLYDKLPRLLFQQVVLDGPLKSLKSLKLSEADYAAMAERTFDPDWLAEEVEILVEETVDEVRGPSGGRLQMAIDISGIKSPLGSAISTAIENNVDSVPGCGSARRPAGKICKPKGVDEQTFLRAIGTEVSTFVSKIPSKYSLLSDDIAAAMETLRTTLDTLGTIAVTMLLLALGFGGGAVFLTLKNEADPPVGPIGIGLAAGGGVLFLVVTGVKKGISAATGAVTASLVSDVRDTLNAFLDGAVGGGFTVATWILLAALAAGAALIYQGFFANR